MNCGVQVQKILHEENKVSKVGNWTNLFSGQAVYGL